MQLIYDTSGVGGSSYAHDSNEVGIRLQYRSIFDTFHRRMGDIQTWYVIGVKQATSQANLTTALANLEAAYTLDYGNITLKDNSGADSRHTVVSSNTFSGVQVAHFGYPSGSWSMNTEYGSGNACKRTYQVILTAEIRTGAADALYAYREQIQQIGTGGKQYRHMGSLTGNPILQTLKQKTVIRYIQEGFVIGRGIQLSAPSPLALGTELVDRRVIRVTSPKDVRANGNAELYQTSYRYEFEHTLGSPMVPNTYTINSL